jgi:hypothetical protein
MAVTLFSEKSIVMVVAVEDPVVASITEGREGRVAELHVAHPVARPSKLPQVLEILEEILEEV